MTKMRAIIVGNPNAGKTSLFNALSQKKAMVGNWSGVTIGCDAAVCRCGQKNIELIDLPGIYSLVPDKEVAEDYKATIACLKREYDVIINVLSAHSIERDLYLTMQLLELNKAVVICLNFSDEVHNISEIRQVIERELKVPVIITSAKMGVGIDLLKQLLCCNIGVQQIPMKYDSAIIAAKGQFEDPLSAIIEMEQVGNKEEIVNSIMQVRLGAIKKIVAQIMHFKRDLQVSAIDRLVFHKVWGVMIFASVIFLMFGITILVGNGLKGLIEEEVGMYLVHAAEECVMFFPNAQFLKVVIVEGLIGGVVTVLAFLPTICTLFICLGILEGSGYMARAGILADALLKKIGLSGNAFIPLVMGFGCNVPAILATRILDSKAARVKTAMMIPFMSCSARLTVYVLFCTTFFGAYGVIVIFFLYVLGMLMAFLTGYMINVIWSGRSKPQMLIEIPKYRMPSLLNVWNRSLLRVKDFLFDASKTIIVVFVCIKLSVASVLHFGIDKSSLEEAKGAITLPFRPMGLSHENWQLVVGLGAGIIAKEVALGTINSLYFNTSEINEENLGGKISESVVDSRVIIAYLIFMLLYFPCVSVYGTMRSEFGRKWATISVCWSTFLAYAMAVLFYQISILF